MRRIYFDPTELLFLSRYSIHRTTKLSKRISRGSLTQAIQIIGSNAKLHDSSLACFVLALHYAHLKQNFLYQVVNHGQIGLNPGMERPLLSSVCFLMF